jgi:hypothetical protein
VGVSRNVDDPLWRYFVPLWADLTAVAPGLLLAGGYGLFLKQSWLADLESAYETGAVA